MIDTIAKYKLASEFYNNCFSDFQRMSVEDVEDSAYKTAVDCIRMANTVFNAFHKAVEDEMPEMAELVKEGQNTLDITKMTTDDKPLN